MAKARILVIDDEEVICSVLLEALGRQGYHVEAAEDGSAGLKKISGDFFNLLITDLKMPKLDGISVLKEIKKANPYMQVIIITGYPTVELAVEAIKIGAFDFVCKPFDIHEIISRVDKCLERQKFGIDFIEPNELTALFEISKIITAYAGIEALLNKILDSALRIANAKRGSLLLVDGQDKNLNLKARRGLGEEPQGDTGIGPEEESGPFLSIPLVCKNSDAQENILGVINIAEKISGESFTEREQTLLSILSGQAAVAIENHRLYSQLQGKISDLERIIKELEDTRNQLIQSEKMAAVGQLAFGIAHEIRNPLSIILEGVEFLKGEIVNENERGLESIARIKKSVDRANNIIIELLKFSRASKLKTESVDVCKTMEEVLSLVKNQASLNNVQINKNFKDERIPVNADAHLLRQAFFNLCINAIDAMPNGGELSVNIFLAQGANNNENNAIIEVIDTGCGIPEGLLLKIFTPFFTTKEPGKGTGLGLSIVHLILERHHASIGVDSKVNAGAKFTIKFPAQGNQLFPAEAAGGYTMENKPGGCDVSQKENTYN